MNSQFHNFLDSTLTLWILAGFSLVLLKLCAATATATAGAAASRRRGPVAWCATRMGEWEQMRRLTVMLLVNDLRIGGAERQLVELARGLDKERFRVIVSTLYSGQPFENEPANARR